MAFTWAPKGLNPLWGGLAGAGGSVLAGYAANELWRDPNEDVTAQHRIYASLGATAVIGGLMVPFKGTRTAGWAALGGGLVGTLGVYLMGKGGVLMGSHYDRDLLGLIRAREIHGGPVKILSGSGSGRLGLPVAREVRGAAVEVLNGRQSPVSIISGFGTSLGTNFANNTK